METVLRGLVVYIFLLFIFRLSGKRTLAQATSFDLVLLLIISETTQQAMINDDHSLTACMLLVVTLVGMSILLSYCKEYFPVVERLIDDVPTIIVKHGKLREPVMQKLRVDEADVMKAARQLHGLERLEQIKFAIVEQNGQITIVPAA